jgi:hypothetical protein
VNNGAGGGWVGGTVTGPTGGGILIGGCGGGCGRGCGGGCCGCGVVQAASKATIVNKAGTLRRVENIREYAMWILMLEAGTALFLLVFIVWWTMFAGRKPEQPVQKQQPAQPDKNDTPEG